MDPDEVSGFNRNSLAGTIPLIMPSVRQLFLGDNLLSGTLPKTLINHIGLRVLHLSKNKFSGILPNYSFPKTPYLYLHVNNFAGSMQFAAAVPREHVTTHDNDFSGPVPLMSYDAPTGEAVLTLHGNLDSHSWEIGLWHELCFVSPCNSAGLRLILRNHLQRNAV